MSAAQSPGDPTLQIAVGDDVAGGKTDLTFERVYSGATPTGTPVYIYVPQGGIGHPEVKGINPQIDPNPNDSFKPCADNTVESNTITQAQIDTLGDELAGHIVGIDEAHYCGPRSGANGSYRLSRLTRTITRTRVLVNGERSAEVAPGRTVAIGVHVAPGVDGPVTVDVERFDPLAGWQFYTRFRRSASGGSASIAFTPPSVGRWRVHATYDGTRRAAPSGPSTASFVVAEPLQE